MNEELKQQKQNLELSLQNYSQEKASLLEEIEGEREALNAGSTSHKKKFRGKIAGWFLPYRCGNISSSHCMSY